MNRLKGFLGDTLWCALGLLLMNAVAQFLVYPIWNRQLGAEAYGHILTVISAINIFALSAGMACNNARMVQSAKYDTIDGNYGRILLAFSLVLFPVSGVVGKLLGMAFPSLELFSCAVLAVLIMWRYYADAYFRLKLNYRGFFLYYLCVSAGYCFGLYLFKITELWIAALIPGEAVGLIYAIFHSRSRLIQADAHFWETAHSFGFLLGTNLIVNLIFNCDRLLLNSLIGGTAVTVYYIASLFGKTVSLVAGPFNSVIIGYLAKYRGTLNRRMMNLAVLLSIVLISVATIGCTVCSHIILPYLYPDSFLLAKKYILICSLTQAVYFTSGIVLTVLLRFSKEKYQLLINGVYGTAFAGLCLVLTKLYGLAGFCWGALGATVIRLIHTLALGYSVQQG